MTLVLLVQSIIKVEPKVYCCKAQSQSKIIKCTAYWRLFTAETAEVAEKILFIINLSGLRVLCG